ncbi:MAG: hypothetical protein KKD74_02500 [Bacteroidetes bacterium]|nr:hypothetical protein [Bacteroidota bacterium]
MKRLSFILNGLMGLFMAAFMLSCQQKPASEILTERIQYDVTIKSPSPDYDWWIQNLEGASREKLVRMLIDKARNGEVKVHDYFNNPIDATQVAHIIQDTMLYRMMRKEPPYELYDTLVVQHIEAADILRIRFLEEWTIDPVSLQVTKKVLGIAPVARRYDSEGIERWQPLYWIYTDDRYPAKLK